MERRRDFLDMAEVLQTEDSEARDQLLKTIEKQLGYALTLDATELSTLCGLLAQYECMSGKEFAEPSTLSTLFLSYVVQPFGHDGDLVRKYSLVLSSLRQARVECSPSVADGMQSIAQVFSIGQTCFAEVPEAGGNWVELQWFDDKVGSAFLSRYRESHPDSSSVHTLSDRKSCAAKAILETASPVRDGLQQLVDALGVLHATVDSYDPAERERHGMDYDRAVESAALGLRRRFQYDVLVDSARQIAFLLERVKTEARNRVAAVKECLSLAARAALTRSRDEDIAVACKIEAHQVDKVTESLDNLGKCETDIIRSTQFIEKGRYSGAEEEAHLLELVQLLCTRLDEVAMAGERLKLPDTWPSYLLRPRQVCTDALVSLTRFCCQFRQSSQLEAQKQRETEAVQQQQDEEDGEKEQQQEQLSAGGTCISVSNAAWMGPSSLESLGTREWGGAGIVSIFEGPNGAPVALLPTDDGVVAAPRWIGGKRDATDVSWLHTALREYSEETLDFAQQLSMKDAQVLLLDFCRKYPQRCSVAVLRNPQYPKPYVLLVLVMTGDSVKHKLAETLRNLPLAYKALDRDAVLSQLPEEERVKHMEQQGFVFAKWDDMHDAQKQFASTQALQRVLRAASSKLYNPGLQARRSMAAKLAHDVWMNKSRQLAPLTVRSNAGELPLSAYVANMLDTSSSLGPEVVPYLPSNVGVIAEDGKRLERAGTIPSIWLRAGWAGLEVS